MAKWKLVPMNTLLHCQITYKATILRYNIFSIVTMKFFSTVWLIRRYKITIMTKKKLITWLNRDDYHWKLMSHYRIDIISHYCIVYYAYYEWLIQIIRSLHKFGWLHFIDDITILDHISCMKTCKLHSYLNYNNYKQNTNLKQTFPILFY